MADNKWNTLSIRDKAELIRLGVQNGIRNLNDIVALYNNAIPWDEIIDSRINKSKIIDSEETALRQMYAESSFTKGKKSNKGAKGLFGIMPSTLKAYKKATGRIDIDLDNYEDAKDVRNWTMQKSLKSDVFNSPQSDSVYYAKQLAMYNRGQGNIRKHLKKKEAEGVDINNSFDWLEDLPEETVNYVNFILRNKDSKGQYTNNKYEQTVKNKLSKLSKEALNTHNNRNIMPNSADVQYLIDKINKSDANFVSRLKDPNRDTIQDWGDKTNTATHKLSVGEINGESIIYPEVQEIDGKLIDFSRPPYASDAAIKSAYENNDYMIMPSFKEALRVTQKYKNYYPNFNKENNKKAF